MDLKKNTALILKNRIVNQSLVVGFDGFVDEIIQVVDKRFDDDNFSRIETINTLAERIASAAGLSANLELFPLKVKLGGNGPIMANAFINQGYNVTYIGAIGAEKIHHVFEEFAEKCSDVITLAEPGHTDALEFNDGKLLLGKLSDLRNVKWTCLSETTGKEKLEKIALENCFFAFTNWTMLTGMNSLFDGFSELFSTLGVRPKVFIDLADPTKRAKEDVLLALTKITNLNKQADVALGLNKNESSLLSAYLGISSADITERARQIREKLNICMVVIHPTEGAAAADSSDAVWVDGPFTLHPKLSTGAGDNFNAGFCNGWLQGLNLRESLICGVGTSGFYVRNEHSPSGEELIDFLNDWANNSID